MSAATDAAVGVRLPGPLTGLECWIWPMKKASSAAS